MYDKVIVGTTATVRATKYAKGKNKNNQYVFVER